MNNQSNTSVTKNEVESFLVRFDGFEGLPTTKSNNNFVDSPEFTCFGHQWCLRLHPGGARPSPNGNVAVYLFHKSGESIEVQARFTVKQSRSKVAAYLDLMMHNYQPPTQGSSTNAWGPPNFAQRSTLIGTLNEGALVIEVQMRQPEPINPSSQPFVPENPLFKNILNKFMDEETSDVIFEVSSEQATDDAGEKRLRTSTTFHAHRFILQECTSALGELCKSSGDPAPIPINDVKPDIFRHMLYYLYGGKLSDDDLKANAKDIIDAADKYGAVGLKLEAEASFVTSTTITIDNVMDNLLYADSKNCALLKEAAMDFIARNRSEAAKRVNFENFPGHLVKDLLISQEGASSDANDVSTDPNDFSTMRVSALRKMLHEKGLDIDGSRETMIGLLQEESS